MKMTAFNHPGAATSILARNESLLLSDVSRSGSREPTFEYLDEAGAAVYLKSSRRRLKDLRLRGGGPPFVRLGAAVRYRSDWLDAWAVQNAVSSTSEEVAKRRDGPSLASAAR
jgi:hypothetical protein